MNRFQLPGTAALLLVSLGMACTKPGPGDEAISNDIKAKLYSDAATKAANIGVAVKDGAVTLTGEVPSSDVELEAMKVANASPGVKAVSDQLKVDTAAASVNQLPDAGSPPPSSSQPAPAAPTSTPTASIPPPSASTPAPGLAPSSPPPPLSRPQPVRVTVPAGTPIAVRMIDSIDSGKNSEGQTFRASLTEPLMAGGRVVIPAGNNATVLLTEAKGAGRIKGSASLDVRLASVDYRGRTLTVDTTAVQQAGSGGRGKSTAVRTGIGAAAGAVIGALAGGGKGAAIGSAAGGGAGFGINALTHGKQVKIASETVLTFTLQSPLTVPKEVE